MSLHERASRGLSAPPCRPARWRPQGASAAAAFALAAGFTSCCGGLGGTPSAVANTPMTALVLAWAGKGMSRRGRRIVWST